MVTVVAAPAIPAPRRAEATKPAQPAASALPVAGRLERLAALHASGELTDDEYAQAKKATLQEEELDR